MSDLQDRLMKLGEDICASELGGNEYPRNLRLVADAADRITELEAACRTALDAYSRVSRVRLPGDVAGDLVHARETLRRALGLAN